MVGWRWPSLLWMRRRRVEGGGRKYREQRRLASVGVVVVVVLVEILGVRIVTVNTTTLADLGRRGAPDAALSYVWIIGGAAPVSLIAAMVGARVEVLVRVLIVVVGIVGRSYACPEEGCQ